MYQHIIIFLKIQEIYKIVATEQIKRIKTIEENLGKCVSLLFYNYKEAIIPRQDLLFANLKALVVKMLL